MHLPYRSLSLPTIAINDKKVANIHTQSLDWKHVLKDSDSYGKCVECKMIECIQDPVQEFASPNSFEANHQRLGCSMTG